MNTTKIIELFIDEEYEEAGIEAISLVSKPAHDETWMAFKRDECSCGTQQMSEEVIDEYSPYTIVADDFCSHNRKRRMDYCESGKDYSTGCSSNESTKVLKL